MPVSTPVPHRSIGTNSTPMSGNSMGKIQEWSFPKASEVPLRCIAATESKLLDQII